MTVPQLRQVKVSNRASVVLDLLATIAVRQIGQGWGGTTRVFGILRQMNHSEPQAGN